MVAFKPVTVKLTNCVVKELTWPTATLEISKFVADPQSKTIHSNLSTSVSPCTYPVAFKLYWDKQEIVSSSNFASFDFT